MSIKLVEQHVDKGSQVTNVDLAITVYISVSAAEVVGILKVAVQLVVDQGGNVVDVDQTIVVHVTRHYLSTYSLDDHLEAIQVNGNLVLATHDAEGSLAGSDVKRLAIIHVIIPEVLATLGNGTIAEGSDVSPATIVVVLGKLGGEAEVVLTTLATAVEGNGCGVEVVLGIVSSHHSRHGRRR